jgi:hypothetical protein|tara:strand:- start:6157 stop:6462 length:306 start_codon:yes stop_codon:yes gene_type:complete
MFDEVEDISFDNQGSPVREPYFVPADIQDKVNTIVNSERASLVKDDTKELFKGVALGSVIGAILSLWRKKSVWLGVLAGGLAGGYLTKEGIIDMNNIGKKN